MTRSLKVISVSGPYTKRPSGRFKRDGETPILVRCAPFWVVRVLHNTVLRDHKFSSEAKARAFAARIESGEITEEYHEATGFMLRGV